MYMYNYKNLLCMYFIHYNYHRLKLKRLYPNSFEI